MTEYTGQSDDSESPDWTTLALGFATAAVAVAAVTYHTMAPSQAVKPSVDMNNQTLVLEDGSRRSIIDVELEHEEVKTLYDVFQRGIRVSNDGPCLGTIDKNRLGFVWLSYKEVFEQAQRVGSALMNLGLTSHPGHHPRADNIVGLFSQNRAEWVVTDQACIMFSLVTVPLYDTLGEEACQFIITQTEMSVIICDTVAKLEIILSFLDRVPSVKLLVVMDEGDVTQEQRVQASNCAVSVVSFENFMAIGVQNLRKPEPPSEEDVASITYTSGTTGNPKGVMLTHASIVHNTKSIATTFKYTAGFENSPKDAHLSFLPLAHAFERTGQVSAFMHGVKVGFFSGDIKLLGEDLKLMRPTVLPVVPRLLNRIYDKVMAGVQGSAFKRCLLNWAIKSKIGEYNRGIIRKNSIWDKLVFKKLQDSLGGNVEVMVTGAAPLATNVLQFFRAALGCQVIEAYGQTEANAGISMTLGGDSVAGHVGPPLIGVRVKLEDVPDMEYFARDGRGEVCAKGPNIMVGYYKEKEKTAETLDGDGWLHTGDIGEWTKEGTLRIIDRKKHIFKLAQGEYIAPEKIENVYTRSPMVAQCFVDGDSLRAFLVAIVVPDPDVIPTVAANNGLQGSVEELCKSQVLKEIILKDMFAKGKQSGLKSFEQVKDIHLHPEMFSVESGLLTPTFKCKRPQARKYFKEIIDEMYDKRID